MAKQNTKTTKMKFDKEILQVLCPFGEWKHTRGMQVVDEESARLMKRAANWSPMSSIPIYVGHPDDFPSKKRPKAVGKIKRICMAKDGIAVLAAYSEESYKQVISGALSAMSPRWQMSSIGDGKYRPIKLISVGLTNNPNIPDSGRILNASKSEITSESTANIVKQTNQRLKTCLSKIRNIANDAKKTRKHIDSLKISERISKRTPTQKSVIERKKDIARICDIARERSERLGEPYTKSFAYAKKQIL